LAIAVLVMIVVNAQLTWWIVFTIGEARDRLELERALLRADARSWATVAAVLGPHRAPPVPDGFELVAVEDDDSIRPTLALGGDYAGRAIRPTEAAWADALETYRRHIVMMVSEGAFFALLLVVLVGLLWRTLRREVELERQHRNFLSAITHELKSPLAAIRLSLETVTGGRADGNAAQRFLGNALVDTDRLERLVSKVLQATRYGAGAGTIRLGRQSISRIVDGAVDDFDPRATAAAAEIASEIEPDVWGSAVDPEALTIAVSNLLENALTYGGEPARIEIRLATLDGNAVIEVEDNGAGIAEQDLPHIFHRFYRTGDEMTRTTQGTGLGLYLVQRIVKAHHGTVAVASTGADGTVFRVVLPGAEVAKDRQ
jgi:signal transduction histidine kinase